MLQGCFRKKMAHSKVYFNPNIQNSEQQSLKKRAVFPNLCIYLEDIVVGAPDPLERRGVLHERPHAARLHLRRAHLHEPEGARARVQPRLFIGAGWQFDITKTTLGYFLDHFLGNSSCSYGLFTSVRIALRWFI